MNKKKRRGPSTRLEKNRSNGAMHSLTTSTPTPFIVLRTSASSAPIAAAAAATFGGCNCRQHCRRVHSLIFSSSKIYFQFSQTTSWGRGRATHKMSDTNITETITDLLPEAVENEVCNVCSEKQQCLYLSFLSAGLPHSFSTSSSPPPKLLRDRCWLPSLKQRALFFVGPESPRAQRQS